MRIKWWVERSHGSLQAAPSSYLGFDTTPLCCLRMRAYLLPLFPPGDTPQAWQSFLPYKLQLAAVLADCGQVSRALQYCSNIDAALRAAAAQAGSSSSTPSGIPPSLMVMASQLEALRERLSTHAAAHNIKVIEWRRMGHAAADTVCVCGWFGRSAVCVVWKRL